MMISFSGNLSGFRIFPGFSKLSTFLHRMDFILLKCFLNIFYGYLSGFWIFQDIFWFFKLLLLTYVKVISFSGNLSGFRNFPRFFWIFLKSKRFLYIKENTLLSYAMMIFFPDFFLILPIFSDWLFNYSLLCSRSRT